MGLLDIFRRKPSPDQFAKLLVDRIKAAGDPRPVDYDAENFCLTSADRGAITNLHNLYAEYERATAEERELVVKNFLAAWFTTEMELPETLEDARHDLLLAIRGRSYYEVGVALMSDELEPNHQLPYEEIAGCLAVSPIYDLPTSIRSLSQDDLENWDVTLYEALEIAKQNLLESTREVAQAEDLYMFASGDSHDAARLVLTELIESLDVDGDPVAMIPNREMLLVTGTDSETGLDHMVKIAAEGVDHERGISGVALRLEFGQWQLWLPPEDHTSHNDFALLRAQSIGADYAQQKVLLDRRHKRDGEDLFVAAFNATRNEATGKVHTFCAWQNGIELLLPEADYVLFGDPNSVVAMEESSASVLAAGDWQSVMQHAGHLLEPVDCYPPRHRVLGFPEPEVLQAIGIADWVRGDPS